VACWGATELMRDRFGLPITVITGPATDNEVGQVYIQTELGLPAHNARRDAAGLLSVVRESLQAWREGHESQVTSPSSAEIVSSSTRDSRLATIEPR
jgi:nicotinamide mononucleotide (NMN) deamidase PncC